MVGNLARTLAATAIWLALATVCPAAGDLSVSPGGHFFVYRGQTIMLVGDSGTQCVMQNLNIDYRRWVADCAARGLNAVHIWALVPPRQKQDGSVMERRYGYVYPGATPWKRRAGGPPATDQLPRWDLTRFDEGTDPARHWWPRLRDLAACARDRGLVLGVTVFFGWPKHAEPQQPDWSYHPFNVVNGGHLANNNAVQFLASPGREVLGEEWSEAWPAAKKTQWIWERYADKLIRDLNPYGNVFYVFMDEHSYTEGNCGDHFLQFFKKRGALYVDWNRRRRDVDAVYVDTAESTDRNRAAVRGFDARPARPLLLLEGPPYVPAGSPDVRRSMWTFALGGGHFVFHDDEGWRASPMTGIMGYDPKVANARGALEAYDALGAVSRFFNGRVGNLDAMAPHNELTSGTAKAYCLARPGEEYAVYLPAGGTVRMDLADAAGATFAVEWVDPATGKSLKAETVEGGKPLSLTPPERTNDDWVLHLKRQK